MNQDITVSGTIFMLYSLSMDFEVGLCVDFDTTKR